MSNLTTVKNEISQILNDGSINDERIFFARIFSALAGLSNTANTNKQLNNDCVKHFICNFEGCTDTFPANTINNGEGGKYYSLYDICTAANNTNIALTPGEEIGLNIMTGRNSGGQTTFLLEMVKKGTSSQSLDLVLDYGNSLVNTPLAAYFQQPNLSRTRPANPCKE